MRASVIMALGVIVSSGPVLAAGAAQTAQVDPWAELIQAGQKEESIVSRSDRAFENQTLNRSLASRKARGLAGVLYGGFGFNSLVIGYIPVPSGSCPRYYSCQFPELFLGGMFTIGAGLRLPLSLHWDLQSRISLGFAIGNYDSSDIQKHTGFGLAGDLTFRARAGGATGRAGYFGMGVIAGGQFGYLTAGSTASTTMAVGFAGGILEAGGVWGSKEQWDLGLRWSFAGGNLFMSSVSLVFGGVIGQTKQELQRQPPVE